MGKRKRGEFWRRLRADGTEGDIYWTNLFGQRVSTGFADLKAAKIWKQARLREGADPRFAAAQTAEWGDAVREFRAELRRRGRSIAYQGKAEQKLGHTIRLWGEGCKLATIDARLIGHYIDQRLTEPGAKVGTTVARITIRDELGFIGQTLALARRQGRYPYVLEDVMPLVFDVNHKPKKTWIKERDFPKLLRALTLRDRRAHLAWIVATGSRWGESLRACRDDVDLTTYRVRIRGSKTEGSTTTITIPSRMRRWLRYALKHADADRVGQRRLFDLWGKAARDMHAACERAGIPPVGPHDLRRTFGKWLRLHGFDLDLIAKLLRHTTDKLAREVYADVEGDELAAIVGRREEENRMYRNRTLEKKMESK